jgi:hypothetical protein
VHRRDVVGVLRRTSGGIAVHTDHAGETVHVPSPHRGRPGHSHRCQLTGEEPLT